MRFFRFLKKIIYKTCGKARWLLLAFVLLLGYTIFTLFWYPSIPYLQGVQDSDGFYIYESELHDISAFAITHDGDLAVRCGVGQFDATGFFNIDTGEQGYAGIGLMYQADENDDSVDIYYPMNFALTDDGALYALHYHQDSDLSMYNLEESIVRYTSDYKPVGDVFSIKHDASERIREPQFSSLDYYDGYVYFAVTAPEGVTLYAINTDTQVVTASDLYPTDPDGTYTVKAIPIDGEFLFERSDGNVYRVAFGDPLGDSIYKFDTSDESDTPYLYRAVVSDGKLYVTADRDPLTVYLLEDGELTEVANISAVAEDPGLLICLDTYRPAGASHDSLVIVAENAFYTYTDGKLTPVGLTIRPQITALMYTSNILNNLVIVPLIGLVINLIIRKKTLLYKQLIITIPILLILSVIIASSIYNYADNSKKNDVANDMSMICELASESFDGYDFSGLTKVDEDTGNAYAALTDKLGQLSSNRDNYWSKGYSFSIIYRDDAGNAYLLAEDGNLLLPMNEKVTLEDDFAAWAADSSSKVYLSNGLGAIVGIDAGRSTIDAYGKINDKDSTGNYYLKVKSDYGILATDRSNIYYQVALYAIGAITVITLLLVFSLLMILRVINKATKTVKSIADGDLTARVNYKSKDELGEICTQVNEMAGSLEKSFEEKDRTEKFYYKFVPEKFREYLGKDSFTDLSLGDASSRELTVLFCDIRSFSINSEMMTAKENFAFVNTIYGKAGPIIREHNGFVDKYIGDAVMALFEDPDDAVHAGVELYRAIVLDPATAEELNVSDINIGIGIHTGMAMIGIVGESERLSGTVISDTVNLSSRLETLTKQYKTAILLSKDTVDRMTDPDSLELRYLGMVQVAGVNEVKGVYEVLDCLKDDVKKARESNVKDFREALRLFQLGRREDAAKMLEKLASEGRSDFISDMYLDYIRSLSPEDKGNVFRFVRK